MLAGKNDLVPSTKYTHGEVNINSAAVYYALRYFCVIILTNQQLFHCGNQFELSYIVQHHVAEPFPRGFTKCDKEQYTYSSSC